MEPKVFWGKKKCQGLRGKHTLKALILMGAWCEAVLVTTVSQLKNTMKPRVLKQSQVETSWWYTVKKPNFLLQERCSLLTLAF
jgi:hypothetical protein